MLVSVIIPSFNHSKYISSCIRSVLNQTYEDFELIIVDDQSSDNSVEVIGEFTDSRITLIQQENSGATTPLTEEFHFLLETLFAILNSDDEFAARWLETGCRE